MNSTPASRSLRKFSSAPRRRKLSNATIRDSGKTPFRAMDSAEPANPAPPVTRTHSGVITLESGHGGSVIVGSVIVGSAMIVAARQGLLEPQVEDDEEIAAAHFLDAQLGYAGFPVCPGDRNHAIGVAAHNGLQRHLDGQVEVRRNERLHRGNHFTPVYLEGVRNIVEPKSKEHADKEIRQTIQQQFMTRIIDNTRTLDKPGSEHAITAGGKLAIIADKSLWTIGAVTHHDGHRVTGGGIKTGPHSHTESVPAMILDELH